jgi:hypothetical protein
MVLSFYMCYICLYVMCNIITLNCLSEGNVNNPNVYNTFVSHA